MGNSITLTAEVPETQLDTLAQKVAEIVISKLQERDLSQPIDEADEIGGVIFASEVTGYAVPTIYDLVHKRKIPHSKPGGKLNFSKKELLDWMLSNKRKTQAEIEAEAASR